MTNSVSKQFDFGDLVISIHRSDRWGTVRWMGTSDARNPAEFLNPLADTVVEEMLGAKVTVDFTQLEFMNSSTVAPIINLIRKLEAADIEARIVFVDSDWQRSHLRCMRTITRGFKNVKVEGRSEVVE